MTISLLLITPLKGAVKTYRPLLERFAPNAINGYLQLVPEFALDDMHCKRAGNLDVLKPLVPTIVFTLIILLG